MRCGLDITAISSGCDDSGEGQILNQSMVSPSGHVNCRAAMRRLSTRTTTVDAGVSEMKQKRYVWNGSRFIRGPKGCTCMHFQELGVVS
jgi:hypothetical protein